MCTRFVLKTKSDAILKLLGVETTVEWPARYNIAPSQVIPAVTRTIDNPQRRLGSFRWGFTQTWAQGGRLLVNARSEEIREKPLFRDSFEKWRCLIPMDGFYEWRHEGNESRPYYIRRKDQRPFAVAGLWAVQDDQGQKVEACVVLTTEPNELVGAIHDRMPVILGPDDHEKWLDREYTIDFSAIKKLMRPSPARALEAFEVSRDMNDAKKDDPSCIEPFTNPGTLSLPF